MKIAVVDGQGGGIGKYIIQRLREELPRSVEIIALGTNALATANMLKAGANDCASGDAAIMFMVCRVDIIVGSVAILAANAFLGELTPAAANAVATSEAKKVLLPVNRAGIIIAGEHKEPLPHQVDKLLAEIKEILEGDHHV